MPRTRTCTQAIRSGRMRKANQFLAAADNLVRSDANETAEIADAYVTLCVHSAIAASDVVCCVSLGEHAKATTTATRLRCSAKQIPIRPITWTDC